MVDREINITYDNWIDFLESTGFLGSTDGEDSIHTIEGAKKAGLEKAVAPGPFVLSHIKGDDFIGSIRHVNFISPVYDGDILKIKKAKKDRRIVTDDGNPERIFNYEILRGEETVCNISEVSNSGSKIIETIKKPEYTSTFNVTDGSIKLYNKSIGLSSNQRSELYFTSIASRLIAESLSESGFKPFYATHSLRVKDDFQSSEMKIDLENVTGFDGKKGNFRAFKINWSQNGRVLASGDSTFISLREVKKW